MKVEELTPGITCVVYDNGSQRRELEEDTPFTVTEVKDKPCVFDTNREVVAGGVNCTG